MIRTFIGLTTCLILTLTIGPIASAEHKEPGDVGRGAKFYSDNCARCHNARPPVEHRDREWSVVIVHMRIVAKLPGAQARDIEAFLRASNNPARPAVRETSMVPGTLSGTQLLNQYGCRGCHVIGGTGGTIGPDLDTVLERREEAWLRVQIGNPRRHNPDSVMPEFGLTREQIDAMIEVFRKSQ